MPDDITVGPIPPRQHAGWRDWAALIVATGLGLGVWHVDAVGTRAAAAADRATAASTVNRQIGYRNRAAICDFIREFGGVEPRNCADPAIGPYRDPRIRRGIGERRNTTGLLCAILTAVHGTPQPACRTG